MHSSPPGPAPTSSASAGGDVPLVRCPGCRSVLVPVAGDPPADPTAACARLFEETTRGLRDEAAAGDPGAAGAVALADATYAAQHPAAAGTGEAVAALAERLGRRDVPAAGTPAPAAWQTTVADVAADLDVVDLPVLLDSWARAVLDDWRRGGATADR